MSYKEINMRSVSQDSCATEIMYEVAACRADGIELLRLNILLSNVTEQGGDYKKLLSRTLRLLKEMKQRGAIRLFAADSSFETGATEAVYLMNKYPERFIAPPTTEDEGCYIYIRI